MWFRSADERPAGAGPLAQTAVIGSSASWHQQDYAWTHSASVEGFFVVLTIVIVPVAILRWLRRLRPLASFANERRHRDAES